MLKPSISQFNTRIYKSIALACLFAPPAASLANDTLIINFPEPLMDKWNYSFNQTIGVKSEMKIFGAFTETGLSPDFDNRDGQGLIAFDTSTQVTPCFQTAGYNVTVARVHIQIESDNTFEYDSTQDDWTTYLQPTDPSFTADPDAGRPQELYGVGFRFGVTPLTYTETLPFSFGSPIGKSIRVAYPLAFDASNLPFDVSNTIDTQINPVPFAVGTTTTVPLGNFVPQLTTFTFEINTSDPDIQNYLREGLRTGRLYFSLASLFPASEQVGGTFPSIFTKENLAVIALAASAAQLDLEVDVIGKIGDLDLNGVVNVEDLLTLLGAWGSCQGCPSDTNCDNVVNVEDLLDLLGGWG